MGWDVVWGAMLVSLHFKHSFGQNDGPPGTLQVILQAAVGRGDGNAFGGSS